MPFAPELPDINRVELRGFSVSRKYGRNGIRTFRKEQGMSRPKRPFTTTIQTAKGEFRACFQSIYSVPIDNGYEDRALILVGSEQPRKGRLKYPAGSVFIRNRDLEQRTNGDTAWMAFTNGLYEAWRVGGYIERNAGGLTDGEIYELMAERDAAHDYVEAILGPELIDTETHHRHMTAFHRAASQLGSARDVRKALAHRHFSRAQDLTDSLGRRNPGAAAMRVGTGIGLLDDRKDELEFILRHVGIRTFRVFNAIQHVMKVYEVFRWHLNRTRRGRAPNKLRLVILADQGDTRRALSAVEDLEGAIKSIHAEPFRKNAHHMLRDLESVAEAIRALGTEQDAAAKQKLELGIKRLRQGLAWPFALDFLEMRIIAPLAWLLNDVGREQRSPRKKKRASANGISHADAPKQFDALADRIRDFRSRVDLCDDDHLKTPVKAEVLARTDEALEYVGQDDWASVKEELQFASELL